MMMMMMMTKQKLGSKMKVKKSRVTPRYSYFIKVNRYLTLLHF